MAGDLGVSGLLCGHKQTGSGQPSQQERKGRGLQHSTCVKCVMCSVGGLQRIP